MKKTIYVTTVKIAVVATSEDEAFDAISMGLSEHLQQKCAILDWKYDVPEYSGRFVERGEYKPKEYEEGQAFVDNYMERVKDALREGRKLMAIKIYKEATGEGLREAKDVIDGLCPEFLKKDDEPARDFLQEHKDQNSKPKFIHFKE